MTSQGRATLRTCPPSLLPPRYSRFPRNIVHVRQLNATPIAYLARTHDDNLSVHPPRFSMRERYLVRSLSVAKSFQFAFGLQVFPLKSHFVLHANQVFLLGFIMNSSFMIVDRKKRRTEILHANIACALLSDKKRINLNFIAIFLGKNSNYVRRVHLGKNFSMSSIYVQI